MRRSSATHRSGTRFLRTACAGDDELRREVESLLVHAGRVDEFLGASTMQAVAYAMVLELTSFVDRRPVGAYGVVEYIGSRRYGRGVPSPRHEAASRRRAQSPARVFLKDPERLARFQREAHRPRLAQSSPHWAIYGLEESKCPGAGAGTRGRPHACRPNRTGPDSRSTKRARLQTRLRPRSKKLTCAVSCIAISNQPM